MFSTVGIGVSDGNEVGVSEEAGVPVKGSVGLTEAVCVTVGARGVSDAVTGFIVLAGGLVPAGTEDGGKLQADKANITRAEKTSFRLIGEVYIPFQVD
jgi:hypothetical protein